MKHDHGLLMQTDRREAVHQEYKPVTIATRPV